MNNVYFKRVQGVNHVQNIKETMSNIHVFIALFYNFFEKKIRGRKTKSSFAFFVNVLLLSGICFICADFKGGREGEWKLKNHFFFNIFKVKLLKICLPHSANYSNIPRTPLKNVCGSAHHWSFVVLVNFFDVCYSNLLSLL